ncbi:MAG: DUF4491 family protein [Bacteroidaceae bacterium]|nr:DUF4491 family protein [Bacteroidaceae bacterium]MBQ5728928.1 DUF4491 family protein [Bacteroidaceae bacterium]
MIDLTWQGLLLGGATFLTIGIFHPIVIKTEYYFGTRPWWLFLLLGLVCSVAALLIKDLFWSALLSIVGFSSFWTIKELFDQQKRVEKGWFPRNPKRKYPEQGQKNG